MPSQSHSGWNGVPWHRCDRCGYDYPVSQLRRQSGLILCVVKCIDKEGDVATQDRNREFIKQQVLSEPSQEPQVASILTDTAADVDD